ncbi:YcxB family protein [Shewanella acanthi]|uniref:YcxB family protein n=1 Tax=Shewanella acanthi TaxID=2864212 RepID=UPI001C65DDBE|nr:YcxB family protein [Shewanella acanthi]QYJ78115.1 YcxB family protein [Shewanella acanthi]
MKSPFSYSTTYILDKAHFEECYNQSVKPDPTLKPYYKAMGFGFIGIALIFTNLSLYLAYFFVGLGVIDALNVKYHKSWWLMRQMISKAANNEVTLTIDEQGVHTHSQYVKGTILWNSLYRITPTERGFLLTHQGGNSYLSNQCLSQDCIDFIQSKI